MHATPVVGVHLSAPQSASQPDLRGQVHHGATPAEMDHGRTDRPPDADGQADIHDELPKKKIKPENPEMTLDVKAVKEASPSTANQFSDDYFNKALKSDGEYAEDPLGLSHWGAQDDHGKELASRPGHPGDLPERVHLVPRCSRHVLGKPPPVLRSRAEVAEASRRTEEHRRRGSREEPSPATHRRSEAGLGAGRLSASHRSRAHPALAGQSCPQVASLGAGQPATPPPAAEQPPQPGAELGGGLNPGGLQLQLGGVSPDDRQPSSPRTPAAEAPQDFENASRSDLEVKTEPETDDDTDEQSDRASEPVEGPESRFSTLPELTFAGCTVEADRRSSPSLAAEALNTPSHRIAICLVGGGAHRPGFPSTVFPQLRGSTFWVAQTRLIKENPAEVAAFLEDAAVEADLRYVILCLSPGKGIEAAAVRRRGYEVFAHLPTWRRLVIFHAGAPRGSLSTWRTSMRPLGTWKQTSLDAAGFGGGHEDVELYTLGFRNRRPSRARRRKAPWVQQTMTKDVLTKIIDDAVALDLRAEYPNDPALTDGGRVHRHSALGGRIYDPAAEKRQEDLDCSAGMRDPAELIHRWPALWRAMAPVAAVLLEAQSGGGAFAGLVGCVGDAPSRPPPSELELAGLRRRVAQALGVPPDRADDTHPAAPWRFRLVAAVQDAAQDPDAALREWLSEGAPMGIKVPIAPGGLFPLKTTAAEIDPEDVFMEDFAGNHPSFGAAGTEAPGLAVVQGHLDAGFGELFANRAAAEHHFGEQVAPAPLGCITKQKPDGSLKHRVIMDLKANSVNRATALPERQVLPTILSHAADLAELAEGLGPGGVDDYCIQSMVLDFKDAFMGIPLAALERPFNAAELPQPIRRNRPELFEGEAAAGTVIVWRVLGFGGRPNPLVFARAASFAARSAQALLRPTTSADQGCSAAAVGRLQLYVDDPVLTVLGTTEQREIAFDVVLLWWLVLGLPLAWAKGTVTENAHRWIGADFDLLSFNAASPQQRERMQHGNSWTAVVRPPPEFLQELAQDLELVASGVGAVTLKIAERLVGRAGRLAYLVPACRPYVLSLYAALTAGKAASVVPEDERCHLPARRFAPAARWLLALVRPRPEHEEAFPLEHFVVPRAPKITFATATVVYFDASLWGGGAVLYEENVAQQWMEVPWTEFDLTALGLSVGNPADQTAFEYLMLFLALDAWADRARLHGLAILGDNIAALQCAVSLRGRGPLNTISREIAWRRLRRNWWYSVGHVPSEDNAIADALSRTAAPDGAERKDRPAGVQDLQRVIPTITRTSWETLLA